MIQNLYLSSKNGELLFYYNIREKAVDENILVGFLAATGNFSKEAFNEMIDVMEISDERKLVLHYMQKEGLITAAIIDKKDDLDLVDRILGEFTASIIEDYGTNIDAELIDKENLEQQFNRILKGKRAARNVRTYFVGLIIMLAMFYPLFMVSMNVTTLLVSSTILRAEFDPANLFVYFIPMMLLITISYMFMHIAFPVFLSGFIVGRQGLGFLNGVIFFGLSLLVYYFLQLEETFYIFISYTPILLIFIWFFSYLGVRLARKKKLFR